MTLTWNRNIQVSTTRTKHSLSHMLVYKINHFHLQENIRNHSKSDLVCFTTQTHDNLYFTYYHEFLNCPLTRWQNIWRQQATPIYMYVMRSHTDNSPFGVPISRKCVHGVNALSGTSGVATCTCRYGPSLHVDVGLVGQVLTSWLFAIVCDLSNLYEKIVHCYSNVMGSTRQTTMPVAKKVTP